MRFDGVDFNIESVSRMTEDKFVNHEMHANHYTHLPEKEKKELLRSIYKIIGKLVESDTNESVKGQG